MENQSKLMYIGWFSPYVLQQRHSSVGNREEDDHFAVLLKDSCDKTSQYIWNSNEIGAFCEEDAGFKTAKHFTEIGIIQIEINVLAIIDNS